MGAELSCCGTLLTKSLRHKALSFAAVKINGSRLSAESLPIEKCYGSREVSLVFQLVVSFYN